MKAYNGKMSGNSESRDNWDDSHMPAEDVRLLDNIGRRLIAVFDAEEIISDPDYEKIQSEIEALLSDSTIVNESDRNFVIQAVKSYENDEKLKRDISDIKKEIEQNKLNQISSEWVKEWHARKQDSGKDSRNKKDEIMEFINSSLEKKERTGTVYEKTAGSRPVSRSLIMRYISLAAAVITGTIIVIAALIPGNDPARIFGKYYEPVEAFSPVTRSSSFNVAEDWEKAIENYNDQDYNAAYKGFSHLASIEPASSLPVYYMGVSLLGMEEYEQAKSVFSGLIEKQGEFVKESEWYLGLTYLGLGDIDSARDCFINLAASSDYYRELSEKILRRLK